MNYGQLKQAVKDWSHRSDLDAHHATFVSNVSQRLGRRFGQLPAPLVVDTDSNSLLTTHPNIYLYGCLREVGIYTHNVEAVQAYETLYQNEVNEMNINYRGLDWDACCSPKMEPACCDPTEEIPNVEL